MARGDKITGGLPAYKHQILTIEGFKRIKPGEHGWYVVGVLPQTGSNWPQIILERPL